MLLRHRLLEQENHTRHDIGDLTALVRSDLEDSLIQALEDTHRDGELRAFRSWLRDWGKRFQLWDGDTYELYLVNDFACWFQVHLLTCDLYRMLPRWERSANQLLQEYGLHRDEIPPGKTMLHI